MAVVHTDGGHYVSEYGLEKATNDAITMLLKKEDDDMTRLTAIQHIENLIALTEGCDLEPSEVAIVSQARTFAAGAPAAGSTERWIEGCEIPDSEPVLAEVAYFDCGRPVTEFMVVKLDEDSEDGLLTDGGDDTGWTIETVIRWQKITPALAGTDTEVAKGE